MRGLAASVAAALLFATGAVAQEDTTTTASSDTPVVTGSSSAWSVVSAQTVGEGRNFVHVQAGYPGIFASLLHGQTSTFDVGGKFGFVYGSEAGIGIQPGLRLQGLLRWLISSTDTVRMGFEFEPGLHTYFGFGFVTFGVVLPVKFTAAFPITSAVTLHAGADIPLVFNFTPGFSGAVPILIGGGIEYFLNETISLNLRLRLGPSIVFSGFGAGVTFGLDTMIGAAFRI